MQESKHLYIVLHLCHLCVHGASFINSRLNGSSFKKACTWDHLTNFMYDGGGMIEVEVDSDKLWYFFFVWLQLWGKPWCSWWLAFWWEAPFGLLCHQ